MLLKILDFSVQKIYSRFFYIEAIQNNLESRIYLPHRSCTEESRIYLLFFYSLYKLVIWMCLLHRWIKELSSNWFWQLIISISKDSWTSRAKLSPIWSKARRPTRFVRHSTSRTTLQLWKKNKCARRMNGARRNRCNRDFLRGNLINAKRSICVIRFWT